MSKQRKSGTRKRTLIDIIGEEDYLEFRDVIDTHLQQQEEELQKQEMLEQQAMLAKKKKKTSSSNTAVTRRKSNAKQIGKKKANNIAASTSGNTVTNIVTNIGGFEGQEIMIVDMNNNNSSVPEEDLPIGIQGSLGDIENVIA